ncbi:MAG: hypothetical protein JF600_10200 [Xanthomonadales bacterium]|nr:hypothetical protein [Xanthomonadales bacterium]
MSRFDWWIVRALAALLILYFVSAWFRPAFAQDYSTCFQNVSSAACADQGDATAAALQFTRNALATQGPATAANSIVCWYAAPPVNSSATTAAVYGWYTSKTYGCVWPQRFPSGQSTRTYPLSQQCGLLTPTTSAPSFPGSMFCEGGCEVLQVTSSLAMMTGQSCDPDTPKCRDGYTLNSDKVCVKDPPKCPVDQELIGGTCVPKPPCTAGETRDPTGTCKPNPADCEAGKIKGPDGTCINDTNQPCPEGQTRGSSGSCTANSKDPGGDDDHEASGGDSCSAPPTCTGDAILCLQLRIQWRIDCNTRKNRTITGGTCTTTPVCGGEKCDALEYSQLVMQWRAACALEKLKNPTTETSNEQPEWTKVPGLDQTGKIGASDGDANITQEITVDVSVIDQSGFAGGHQSCPALAGASGGQISGGFAAYLANPPPEWCTFIRVIYWVLVSLNAIACLLYLIEK